MPGETSKTITIPILNDTVYELTERFQVTLSNPAGAALSAASLANVNISSDDAVPTASMTDVIVNEDAGTMTLTLALSHESTQAVTYETTGSAVSGTATRTSDYLNFLQGAFTTITVPAGDSSATFDITLVDDMVNESDETIIIQWTRSPGIEATPPSFTFTGTITDNEGTGVSVSRTALTVTEEDTAGDSYTVVLNTQPTANVTVTVAGHAGTDVTPDPPALTFTPMNWDTAQTVTVTAGNDADTADDTVSLTHSAASTDTNYQGHHHRRRDGDGGRQRRRSAGEQTWGSPNGGHGDLLDFDQAQAFTTGSNSAGYTLTSVEIEMFWNATQDASFAVSIHSDNSGAPGASLGTLTHTGIGLDATTTYSWRRTLPVPAAGRFGTRTRPPRIRLRRPAGALATAACIATVRRAASGRPRKSPRSSASTARSTPLHRLLRRRQGRAKRCRTRPGICWRMPQMGQ